MNDKLNLNFEDSVSRLNEIVKHLEAGDLPLAESLKIFEEASGLIKNCSNMLDEAEQKVRLLKVKADGSPEELPFEVE